MAKLSAHGRSVVHTVVFYRDNGAKWIYRLMSDGAVLSRLWTPLLTREPWKQHQKPGTIKGAARWLSAQKAVGGREE